MITMRAKFRYSVTRSASVIFACAVMLTLTWSRAGQAQSGLSALPAHYRVVEAAALKTRLTLAPSASYGYTESVLPGGGDKHHRVAGAAALAYSHDVGFGIEARFDARYDKHDVRGAEDSGAVLDPRLLVRYVAQASERVAVLGQLGVWIPGEKAPAPSFPATTVDALLAMTVTPVRSFGLTFSTGYRLDHSARSIDRPDRLSEGDWLSLGLSDFNAVLLGVAARKSLEGAAIFAEARWDILVGKESPQASRSPLHAALGFQVDLGNPTTRATLVTDVLVSSREIAEVTAPLVPFDPRFALIVGISHDFTWGNPPPSTPVEEVPAPPVVMEAEPKPEAIAEPVSSLPRGVVRVSVRDTVSGSPIVAHVELHGSGAVEHIHETGDAQHGILEIAVQPGSFEVVISAQGYVSQRRRVNVDEQGVTVINIDLRPKEER
jgi:hypothetical protein